MKKCKNCVYHDNRDGRCDRLSHKFFVPDSYISDCYYGIEIERFDIDNERWDILDTKKFNTSKGLLQDMDLRFAIRTQNWFSCIFHVKMEKSKK